jgi:hypothetical protein
METRLPQSTASADRFVGLEVFGFSARHPSKVSQKEFAGAVGLGEAVADE